jgi:Tfp pilus assembly protein PilF
MTQQQPQQQLTIQQAIELSLRFHQAGDLQQAEAIYRQVLAVAPESPEVLANLGSAVRLLGRLDEAIDCFRRALLLKPDMPETHSNLGDALREKGELEPAIAACRQALALKASYPSAWNNLGVALKTLGQHDQAIDAFRQAITIQPDLAMARFNLAESLLLTGDYEQGWPLYESRWQLKSHQPLRLSFDLPRWDGSDLAGRRILLHVEQGFGDCIQFARYLPLVAQRGGKIILLCQPDLLRLFKNLGVVEHVISRGDTIPEFDLHCPLASLPQIFGTTVRTIPATGPYLRADPGLSSHWRALLPVEARKIGLVWSGRTVPDPNRSVPLTDLAPLFAVPNVQWISLQKDVVETPQITNFKSQISADIRDFADTAAVMENLDLIITIDTAAAHLAGALGKPTWVLLPFVPAWRWMLDRSDSPWYPTVRLFRQPGIGDWRTPIRQIVEELR